LTGAGQAAPKAGWQTFDLPAGTPVNSLFNDHAGPLSKVTVGGGDVITLELRADRRLSSGTRRTALERALSILEAEPSPCADPGRGPVVAIPPPAGSISRARSDARSLGCAGLAPMLACPDLVGSASWAIQLT
jgi:hypothetical protein